MAESTCRYCKQKIKQFFPVNWCHLETMNVYCYPEAKEGTKEANLIATPLDDPIKVYIVRKLTGVWSEDNDLSYCYEAVRVFKKKEDAKEYLDTHKEDDLKIIDAFGEGF